MVTIIEKAVSRLHTDTVLEKAAQILANGGLVAFPTETVYGLGANAYDPRAASKIYEAKGRPSDNPLIVHISRFETLFDICGSVSELARILAERFWPGPLTLVMQKSERVPLEVTGGLDTVAVRMPNHKTALALIDRCGFPLTGPSANSSSKPSPTRATHVAYDLSGRIDMIIDGGACSIGIESTIVDITGNTPVILRPGYISEEDIRGAVKSVIVSRKDVADDEKPKAPGTKYRHYSPKADITIIMGDEKKVADKINELAKAAEKDGKKVGVIATNEVKHLYKEGHIISLGSSDDLDGVGRSLFRALRKFDFYCIDVVFSVGFDEKGMGTAIMNRLTKAAGNKILFV